MYERRRRYPQPPPALEQVSSASGPACVRVILTRDDLQLRRELQHFINENDGSPTGGTEPAAAAARLVQTERGTIILEVSLLGHSGLELLAKLQANALLRPYILGATCRDRAGAP